MKICYIKTGYLDRLRHLSDQDLRSKYVSGKKWISDHFGHNNWYTESRIDIEGYPELAIGESKAETDYKSSILLYESLRNKISIAQAIDPRLWSYLCHEIFWDFMIQRWPPTKDRLDIESRYFLNGTDSRALSRNGIARLWWFAHLTYDPDRSDPYELTKVLLSDQNIQHGFLERSFGRNKTILHAVLDFIKMNSDYFFDEPTKPKVDDLSKMINCWGGARLLDCLSKDEIIAFVAKHYDKVTN